MTVQVYLIGGTWSPAVEVHIEGVPPCLWCGTPVTHPSCDGPLVCDFCDCGRNRDGSKWTQENHNARQAHFNAAVCEYRRLDRARRTVNEARND